MNARADDLDALRHEIDEIDDRMHELLMRRTEVVQRIATVKRSDGEPISYLRPGREAMILRRLLARHQGVLPKSVVVRIWRELISALCRIQGPLKVAVLAPEKSVGYWDMARRQFGSSTPMTLHRSAQNVLRAVAAGGGTVGVLPLPHDDEGDAWWPYLAAGGDSAPQVIARLPFLRDNSGQFEDVSALVVAPMMPEASGEDASLIAITVEQEISRGRLTELLRQADLPAHSLASRRNLDVGAIELHLFEIEGFVPRGDVRVARFLELGKQTVQRAVPLGAYALPFPVG